MALIDITVILDFIIPDQFMYDIALGPFDFIQI